ncbi:BON domain-containing protein [Luteolibacter flavescens]|uniref:BON domain-containing protein n=1 Tax=Luteolibacter flavescens TaxID=1859460 RepID=A0ABT3FT35_9BACT|nr:BON domain-containing protein [Luteolibacter flavescens]MCW1886150.1 BON domain-containing protein [Luteolibacter flavescens]
MKNLARTTRRLLAITALTLATAHATPEIVPTDDAGLADFISMTFSADERLAEDGIRVSVNQGIATLTGRVTTLNQAERAVERTKSVEAVRGVISLIKIAPARTSDQQVGAEIARRIGASPGIGTSSVTVGVRGQFAVIDGKVGTWDEQELAREIASEIPGISMIENRVEASDSSARSDRAIRWQIQRDIADDPLHDGLNISVSVNGGSVRLAGEVGTTGEKSQLIHRAKVAGVGTVNGDGLDVTRSLSMEGMTGKVPSQNAIRQTLNDVFARDKRLKGADVTIDLQGRIVKLGGSAATAEVKAAAESTARGVPGVEIVVNRITVGSPDRQVASVGTGE